MEKKEGKSPTLSGSPDWRNGRAYKPGTTEEVFLPGNEGQKALRAKYGHILESDEVISALQSTGMPDYYANELQLQAYSAQAAIRAREGKRLIDLAIKRQNGLTQ